MASYRPGFNDDGNKDCRFLALFGDMTPKQHEVYSMVAEGRSSKEIAWRLNITESAVNQRIEAVRSRAGSPPRAELARAYRAYSAVQTPVMPVHFGISDDVSQAIVLRGTKLTPVQTASALKTSEPPVSQGGQTSKLVVPQLFVGSNANLNRAAAMAVIAAGTSTAAIMGLALLQALKAQL